MIATVILSIKSLCVSIILIDSKIRTKWWESFFSLWYKNSHPTPTFPFLHPHKMAFSLSHPTSEDIISIIYLLRLESCVKCEFITRHLLFNLFKFCDRSIVRGTLYVLLWYAYAQIYLSHTYIYIRAATTLDSEFSVMWVCNDIESTRLTWPFGV